MQSAEDTDLTHQGLRHMAVVAVVFAAVGALTYVVPKTERVQPWIAGEGVPIVRMYQDGAEALPSFAEAASQGTAAADLSAQIAENLGEAPPSLVTDTHGPAGALLSIAPAEYEGVTQLIEHPEALATFFASLTRTAQRETKAITRVAHYGDSAVAADAITSTARRRLQGRFGDAGHGFILISRGDMHYNHRDVVQRGSSGWEVRSIVRAELKPGYYGYGGVQARGIGGEHAYFSTVDEGELGRSVSRFELYYQRFRGGGPIEIKVDGKKHVTLQTRADVTEDAFEVIEVPDGTHSLSLRAMGSEVRLYGLVLERATPGVVYDSLGLVGARADRLLNAKPEHMHAQIAHRDPDLLVLGFGGNESANDWLNPEQYERELLQVVRFMRAAQPEMACMLFGPLDQAERDARGRIVTIEILPKIIAAQRKVAQQEGCAFYDAFSAMGGDGTMAAWQKTRPRLGTSDLRHATPAGYEVVGNLYYKALLKAFAEYLAGRR